jgi:hypothetical protein
MFFSHPKDIGNSKPRAVSAWLTAKTLAMLIAFSSSSFTLNLLLDSCWQLNGSARVMKKKICSFNSKKSSSISRRLVSLMKTKYFTSMPSRHTKASLSKFTIKWTLTSSKTFCSMLLKQSCLEILFGINYSVAVRKTK